MSTPTEMIVCSTLKGISKWVFAHQRIGSISSQFGHVPIPKSNHRIASVLSKRPKSMWIVLWGIPNCFKERPRRLFVQSSGKANAADLKLSSSLASPDRMKNTSRRHASEEVSIQLSLVEVQSSLTSFEKKEAKISKSRPVLIWKRERKQVWNDKSPKLLCSHVLHRFVNLLIGLFWGNLTWTWMALFWSTCRIGSVQFLFGVECLCLCCWKAV